MIAHRVITSIGIKGSLTFSNLPFEVGQKVEVIILPEQAKEEPLFTVNLEDRKTLQGSLKKYIDPFEGVGTSDWDALK